MRKTVKPQCGQLYKNINNKTCRGGWGVGGGGVGGGGGDNKNQTDKQASWSYFNTVDTATQPTDNNKNQ